MIFCYEQAWIIQAQPKEAQSKAVSFSLKKSPTNKPETWVQRGKES